MKEIDFAKQIKNDLDQKIKETNGQIDSIYLRIPSIQYLQKCNLDLLFKEANNLGFNIKPLKETSFKKLFKKNQYDEFIIAFYND